MSEAPKHIRGFVEWKKQRGERQILSGSSKPFNPDAYLPPSSPIRETPFGIVMKWILGRRT